MQDDTDIGGCMYLDAQRLFVWPNYHENTRKIFRNSIVVSSQWMGISATSLI